MPKKLEQFINQIMMKPTEIYALVTVGEICDYCLKSESKAAFINVFKNCKTSICSRMTPKQKGRMVKMVKNDLNLVCLAIGDGANDVSMILEANIGVGKPHFN